MKGIISFYEKPGCLGNKEQKEKLRGAGYMLQVINILEKDWDSDTLLKFFQGKKVHECVNITAPIIKSNELDPESLSEEELLKEMINDPLLIKRPLIFFRGEFACGFNNDLVERLLGGKQEDTVCRKSDISCNPE